MLSVAEKTKENKLKEEDYKVKVYKVREKGEPEEYFTVERMINLIHTGKRNPIIRKLVAKILYGIEADKEKQFNAIVNFVKDNLQYVNDALGVEELSDALTILDFKRGDCDDFTVLLNTLLENAGFETFIKIISLRDDRIFQHVYPLAKIKGRIIAIDLTPDRRTGTPVYHKIGWQPQGITKEKVFATNKQFKADVSIIDETTNNKLRGLNEMQIANYNKKMDYSGLDENIISFYELDTEPVNNISELGTAMYYSISHKYTPGTVIEYKMNKLRNPDDAHDRDKTFKAGYNYFWDAKYLNDVQKEFIRLTGIENELKQYINNPQGLWAKALDYAYNKIWDKTAPKSRDMIRYDILHISKLAYDVFNSKVKTLQDKAKQPQVKSSSLPSASEVSKRFETRVIELYKSELNPMMPEKDKLNYVYHKNRTAQTFWDRARESAVREFEIKGNRIGDNIAKTIPYNLKTEYDTKQKEYLTKKTKDDARKLAFMKKNHPEKLVPKKQTAFSKAIKTVRPQKEKPVTEGQKIVTQAKAEIKAKQRPSITQLLKSKQAKQPVQPKLQPKLQLKPQVKPVAKQTIFQKMLPQPQAIQQQAKDLIVKKAKQLQVTPSKLMQQVKTAIQSKPKDYFNIPVAQDYFKEEIRDEFFPSEETTQDYFIPQEEQAYYTEEEQGFYPQEEQAEYTEEVITDETQEEEQTQDIDFVIDETVQEPQEETEILFSNDVIDNSIADDNSFSNDLFIEGLGDIGFIDTILGAAKGLISPVMNIAKNIPGVSTVLDVAGKIPGVGTALNMALPGAGTILDIATGINSAVGGGGSFSLPQIPQMPQIPQLSQAMDTSKDVLNAISNLSSQLQSQQQAQNMLSQNQNQQQSFNQQLQQLQMELSQAKQNKPDDGKYQLQLQSHIDLLKDKDRQLEEKNKQLIKQIESTEEIKKNLNNQILNQIQALQTSKNKGLQLNMKLATEILKNKNFAKQLNKMTIEHKKALAKLIVAGKYEALVKAMEVFKNTISRKALLTLLKIKNKKDLINVMKAYPKLFVAKPEDLAKIIKTYDIDYKKQTEAKKKALQKIYDIKELPLPKIKITQLGSIDSYIEIDKFLFTTGHANEWLNNIRYASGLLDAKLEEFKLLSNSILQNGSDKAKYHLKTLKDSKVFELMLNPAYIPFIIAKLNLWSKGLAGSESTKWINISEFLTILNEKKMLHPVFLHLALWVIYSRLIMLIKEIEKLKELNTLKLDDIFF